MKIEDYISGHYEQGYRYKYFVPSKINHGWTWEDSSLSVLLEKASLKLGELNSLAGFVPSIDLFIHLHVTKESVISSRIEGTKTEIDEALFPEDEILPEHRHDYNEVKNYIKALNASVERLKTLPLSTPLLNEAHEILLAGVRGESRQPGELRRSQNWIGGTSLSDAVFIPPSHELIGGLMGDLENFIRNNSLNIPQLIRIAMAHYQFETIHPYLDGNGRIGRLMITLFLVEKRLLDKPLLYLSYFFEKNRNLYYDNLTRTRTANDLIQWVKYFLTGIEQVSVQSIDTLKSILNLKDEIDKETVSWKRRSLSARILSDHLFQNPVIKIKDVQRVCDLSVKASGDLVKAFVEKKLLAEVTGQTRYQIFTFKPYLDLFR
ncbi:MAG: Fic family protein [Ignavibacteria bacterium]|nr:Fic family protein [Ignavibacteria bacterium]